MSDVHASRSLASQALSNLVNQFARPLDFLRELVQNSLDAGTPRVEVAVSYEAGDAAEDGVVAIHVDDFGEGMDERIIDDQLTRLFSSTKEDDLTKIGKFGIGFTSIFAIRPDAVLVHTGRYGEYWELLFHPDRSFEKVRVDKPVTGTRITLFKRMDGDEVDRFVREVRYVLGYWCEHSTTPITFEDRTGSTGEAPEQEAADPFAAFDAPVTAQRTTEVVSRPFGVDEAVLEHHTVDGGVEIVVALAETPRYGFYNGGLTLVNSVNRDVLGSFAPRLGHVSFKVRSDSLEHTLTRDNVLHDDAWRGVMAKVVKAADALRSRLIEACEAACAAGEDVQLLHRLLARECRATPGRGTTLHQTLLGRALFRGHRDAISLERLERQERWLGRILTHPGEGDLARALDQDGVILLRVGPGTQDLLSTLEPPRLLGVLPARRHLVDAAARFLLPQPCPTSELPPTERRLLEAADVLVRHATSRRASLAVGDYGKDGTVKDLVVEGPRDGRLFERKEDGWLRLPLFLRRRVLLVNRHHAHFRALIAASLTDPDVAALALAQALLDYEGLEGQPAFERLVDRAVQEVMA